MSKLAFKHATIKPVLSLRRIPMATHVLIERAIEEDNVQQLNSLLQGTTLQGGIGSQVFDDKGHAWNWMHKVMMKHKTLIGCLSCSNKNSFGISLGRLSWSQ
jgi:hypothetical protein